MLIINRIRTQKVAAERSMWSIWLQLEIILLESSEPTICAAVYGWRFANFVIGVVRIVFIDCVCGIGAWAALIQRNSC